MKALLVLIICATGVAHAAAVQSKFKDYIQKIQTELVRYNKKEIDIVALSQGSLRQTLFTIQTMASLYESKYALLEAVRVDTKSLEDGIGNYRKTIEQYEYAEKKHGTKEQLKALIARKDASEKKLVNQLIEQDWITIPGGETLKLSQTIQKIAWDNESKEKNDSYEMLAAQMERVDRTDWNMTVLEGQGVHDLRKEMRWYNLEFSALTDILGTSGQCPARILKPSQTGGLCLISKCLNDKTSQIYDVFGAIKDEGEGHAGLGEDIDQALLKPAQDLYAEMKKNNLFKNLAQEFRQCVEKE